MLTITKVTSSGRTPYTFIGVDTLNDVMPELFDYEFTNVKDARIYVCQDGLVVKPLGEQVDSSKSRCTHWFVRNNNRFSRLGELCSEIGGKDCIQYSASALGRRLHDDMDKEHNHLTK